MTPYLLQCRANAIGIPNFRRVIARTCYTCSHLNLGWGAVWTCEEHRLVFDTNDGPGNVTPLLSQFVCDSWTNEREEGDFPIPIIGECPSKGG